LAARLLLPGRHPSSLALTAVLSVLGAIAAGWMAERVVPAESAQPARLLFSALGAIAVLLCYEVVTH
jgi:uncharacterized membrane protein YeaQ/YmgE (transglycosylase-associated protein family)